MEVRLGIPPEHLNRLPTHVQNRLGDLDREVQDIITNAQRNFVTEIPRRLAFNMTSALGCGDLMTPYERAQSVSFVTRYEHLADNVQVHLVETDGSWRIGNLWVLRHVLNDFRPIIQNQRDSVYYARVHSTWFQMLRRSDPSQGLVVRVIADNGDDVTGPYSKWLNENKRAISAVLNGLEFGYLYNGILQHSDADLSTRFLTDYVSGDLNYLLWKHIRVLGFIRSLLGPYHLLMSVLTFPSLGGL
jgi:hypothetical protein